MSLIKSISGIRGTIGGTEGDNLTPFDIVKFVSAYAQWLLQQATDGNRRSKVVVGRDARISGQMVDSLVCGTLTGCGIDVVNIGLATTPTTELAVTAEHADGGIIITASHNPRQWNALKLLNRHGEFLSKADGEHILQLATEGENIVFASVDNIGIVSYKDMTDYHIRNVLGLELVDTEATRKANFSVAIDCVNSVGGIAEPLLENLTEISDYIASHKVDVGFVVDPDVDRLAIVCEDGEMFGEEYTLVSVADYILSHTQGNTVSNLSSTRALADITARYGGQYAAAAVGEVNVVEQMKATGAIIGGEGNGGVIYPASHYGRDALVGIALFLTLLAKKDMKVSALRKTYPEYFISKNKIELTPQIDVDKILNTIKNSYKQFEVNDIDGVKIDFPQGWVHLRKSNTEPIVRIYSEAPTEEQAVGFANAVIAEIKRIAGI